MWVRMAAAVDGQDSELAQRKRHAARFFMERVLPQARSLAASVAAGPETIMSMRADLF
jgi:hypothetical protein